MSIPHVSHGGVGNKAAIEFILAEVGPLHMHDM